MLAFGLTCWLPAHLHSTCVELSIYSTTTEKHDKKKSRHSRKKCKEYEFVDFLFFVFFLPNSPILLHYFRTFVEFARGFLAR